MVNENLITLTGTAEAGSSITISYNRYDSYIVTTSDDGTWSVDVTLTEGQNTFFAIATDKADNISDQSMIIILLDTIPPPIPAITTSSKTVTSSSPITIDGDSTDAGVTVQLFNGVTSVGTTTSDGSGDFSFTQVALNDGENSFTVIATDEIGNTSIPSVPVIITLNSPPIPVSTSVTITTTSTTVNTELFVISGTSTDADQITLYKGGTHTRNMVEPDNNGNWSFTITLSEGENILGVVAVNDSNMVSSTDIIITLDVTPPETPILINPSETDPIVYENPTTFTGTAEAGSIVTLYSHRYDYYTAPVADDGTWSVSVAISDVINGFFAYATDSAGNESYRLPIGVIFDTNDPSIITLNGDNPQTIELGIGYTELGATTNDYFPVIIDDTAFIDKVGTYSIFYDSVDSLDNHAVQVIRIIHVVDTTSQSLLNNSF